MLSYFTVLERNPWHLRVNQTFQVQIHNMKFLKAGLVYTEKLSKCKSLCFRLMKHAEMKWRNGWNYLTLSFKCPKYVHVKAHITHKRKKMIGLWIFILSYSDLVEGVESYRDGAYDGHLQVWVSDFSNMGKLLSKTKLLLASLHSISAMINSENGIPQNLVK